MTPYERVKEEITEKILTYGKEKNMSKMRFYYRGHANNTWKIEPSICRNAVEKQKEREMLEEQIKAGNWSVDRSLFDNIARLQHYGKHYDIHTRFLDFTTDIDVAIYFACDDDKWFDVDGEIIMCPYDFRNEEHNDTMFITELALLKEPVSVYDFVDNLINKYPKVISESGYGQSPLMSIGLSVLSWIDHGFMVTPSKDNYESIKEWNPRLYNQKGAFFIPGNKTRPAFPKAYSWNISSTIILPEIGDIPDTISNSHKILKVTVPSADKRAILEELDKKEESINNQYKNFIYPNESKI